MEAPGSILSVSRLPFKLRFSFGIELSLREGRESLKAVLASVDMFILRYLIIFLSMNLFELDFIIFFKKLSFLSTTLMKVLSFFKGDFDFGLMLFR